jgi:hypothetical protein
MVTVTDNLNNVKLGLKGTIDEFGGGGGGQGKTGI